MSKTVKLTKRQLEILAKCAGPHGMYDHTRYETAVLNRLYEMGFALPSCNGTCKWHATQSGCAALSESPAGRLALHPADSVQCTTGRGK